MTPNAITLLFKEEAYNSFPPLEGKPTDNGLLSIRETILPLLMVIPYNLLGGIHSLTAILTNPPKYEEAHSNAKFVHPIRLPLYDLKIKDDTTTIVCIRAEAAHKSRLDDYASYKVAKRGVTKFLRKAIKEVWYNDLKDAETFYTKVTALDIMALLDANSGGLHAINMIGLRTNMHQYYTQAEGIPQFINMMEDAQKKAKRAGMPIANDKLVMAQCQWDCVCHEMHERGSWAAVNGQVTKGRRPRTWMSFLDYLELHKLTVFSADAAKRQRFYIQQPVRKPQRATVGQHISRMGV
jgi:hypothetical protein